MTRLVLFDLDNTLIDRAAAFRAWARAFAGAEHVAWLEEEDGDGLVPRAAFFERVRGRLGLTEPVEQLVAAYRRDYPRAVTPPPEETREALRRLRRAGFRIGIVSNGAPSQLEKIERAGLRKLVDGWAISELAGARKPERAIFEAAAAACGCSLESGWVVGDSPEADVAGARACGLRSVWIDRGRAWPPELPPPDRVAASVAEAAAVVLADANSSGAPAAQP